MLILFDFDGTICDSVDEAIEGANALLARLEQPLISKTEIRQSGFFEIIKKRKVNKLQILFVIFYYRRKMSQMVDTLDSFPGLNAVIKKLAKRHTLGIVTSNSRKNVERFLAHHNLTKYFEIVESEFSYLGKHRKILSISKRKLVDKSKILYIGDETRDVLSAKKAGVKSIAVTWGFEGQKVLQKARPDFIVTHPDQLLDLIAL